MSALTPVNVATLRAVVAFKAQHGYPPTRTDLARARGVSRTAVQYQITALARKGAIRRAEGQPRAIDVAPWALALLERHEAA